MGWLIALGILVLLAIIPVGVSLIYCSDGLMLSLLLGLFKIRILPQKAAKDKPHKKDKKKKEKKPSTDKKKTKTNNHISKAEDKKKSGGKVTDFIPLVQIGLRFLDSFRRKLRVHRLELNYIMAGGDPCDMALGYGKAWEAVGNITPYLDRMFVIRKRNIQVQCDFVEASPTIYARLDISITIGRVIGMAVKYGVLALIEFIKIKNKRKGGTSK